MKKGLENYYYHADGLGSIVALSDNTGAIVETVEYQAYGKPVFKDASGTIIAKSAIGNHYSYTSREYDDETGLFYYRARYYDATTGRFLQEDPIGFGGGNNFYSYAENRPINLFDSFGYGCTPVSPWGPATTIGEKPTPYRTESIEKWVPVGWTRMPDSVTCQCKFRKGYFRREYYKVSTLLERKLKCCDETTGSIYYKTECQKGPPRYYNEDVEEKAFVVQSIYKYEFGRYTEEPPDCTCRY